jgi:hypothetical protein
MHLEANLPSSAGFRHLKRALNAGETVPRFPSLFEQLTACARGPVAVVETPEPEAALEELDDEE